MRKDAISIFLTMLQHLLRFRVVYLPIDKRGIYQGRSFSFDKSNPFSPERGQICDDLLGLLITISRDELRTM